MHAHICIGSRGLSGIPAHVDIIEAGEEMEGGSPESLSLSSRRLAAAVPSYRQCIYTHGIATLAHPHCRAYQHQSVPGHSKHGIPASVASIASIARHSMYNPPQIVQRELKDGRGGPVLAWLSHYMYFGPSSATPVLTAPLLPPKKIA